jgi:hypothetical protein
LAASCRCRCWRRWLHPQPTRLKLSRPTPRISFTPPPRSPRMAHIPPTAGSCRGRGSGCCTGISAIPHFPAKEFPEGRAGVILTCRLEADSLESTLVDISALAGEFYSPVWCGTIQTPPSEVASVTGRG